MPNCTSCGREVYDWEMHYYSSYFVCSDCYRRKYGEGGKNLICTKCARRIGEREANRSLGTTLCQDCFKKESARRAEWVCASCGKNIKIDQKKFKTPDGKTLCEDCARKGSVNLAVGTSNRGKCTKCGKNFSGEGFPMDENKILCRQCAIRHMKGQDKESIAEKFKHLLGK